MNVLLPQELIYGSTINCNKYVMEVLKTCKEGYKLSWGT